MVPEANESNVFNPLGMRGGVAFVEFTDAVAQSISTIFFALGFSRRSKHHQSGMDYFEQNAIRFFLNHGAAADQSGGTAASPSFAQRFYQAHGPSVCGLGLWVDDADAAFVNAVQRGAKPFQHATHAPAVDAAGCASFDFPAIYGIGDSLVYFVDKAGWERLQQTQLVAHPQARDVPSKGFLTIDHLTNNVYRGTLDTWASFYKDIFGFTEVRHFDIRGEQTGLYSFALRSPDRSFCIPINEGKEDTSQIDEYLRMYRGPGVQHIALASEDLVHAIDSLSAEQSGIQFLDIESSYYDTVFDRVPNVRQDHAALARLQILVDGDEEGYLLQIFTQNLIGPIFFELIQRHNHHAFGEGNFGALFRSIERDQMRRGVLDGSSVGDPAAADAVMALGNVPNPGPSTTRAAI